MTTLKKIVIEAFNEISPFLTPEDMLVMKKLRIHLSQKIISKTDLTNTTLENSTSAKISDNGNKANTRSYNLNSLVSQFGASFDRGAILAEFGWQAVPDYLRPHSSVLHIGPRNLNEIFVSIAATRDSGLVKAVDLNPIPGFVSFGDMHDLPFKANSFDIVFIGWVLAYSKDPRTAIKEIMRVSKPDSVIVIGYDKDEERNLNQEYSVSPPWEDVFICKSSSSVIQLFDRCGFPLTRLFGVSEAMSPSNHENKKIMISAAFSKRKLHYFSWNHLQEQLAVSQAINTLTSDQNEFQISRLRSDLKQVQMGFTEEGFDKRAYYFLRQRGEPQRHLDNLLSNNLTTQFPYNNSEIEDLCLPRILSSREINISRTVDEIRNQGFTLLDFKLTDKLINEIKVSFDPTKMLRQGRTIVSDIDMINNRSALSVALSAELVHVAGEYLQCTPIFDGIVGLHTNTSDPSSQSELLQQQSNDAQLFHVDKDRIKWIKFFIYLSDVLSLDDGPHVLLPNSSDLNLTEDRRYSDSELISAMEQANRAVTPKVFFAPKGSIFVSDTSNFHKGMSVARNSRIVLEIQYTNSLIGAFSKPYPIDCLPLRYEDAIKKIPRIFSRFDCTKVS